MKLSQVDKSGELCFHDNRIIETKFKYIQCFHFSQLNNIQVLRISVQQRPALMSLKTRTIIALQMVTKQLFIFSKISYFSLKYALSVSHSQCFLESGKTRFALGSQKEKNPSTKVSSWEAKYMLSDFFPASEMIPEKNRFLPRHCKTLVEMENEIIFTRSHFHFLGNWASAAKNVTCLQNIISLWHSAIIMRKCAQFSIRVTFSRTLYMYIVDFPQLQRTEDLTKGFEISPNFLQTCQCHHSNFPQTWAFRFQNWTQTGSSWACAASQPGIKI